MRGGIHITLFHFRTLRSRLCGSSPFSAAAAAEKVQEGARLRREFVRVESLCSPCDSSRRTKDRADDNRQIDRTAPALLERVRHYARGSLSTLRVRLSAF